MRTNLADHLRSLPDAVLGALLQRRPDLVVPVPADVSALAVRAQSRVSVARALDGLDEFTLQILDAARLTRGPQDGVTSVDAVLAMAAGGAHGGEAQAVRAALRRLRDLLLLYGPDTALHVVGSVDEVCSPYPAGLGRPAPDLSPTAAALCADPAGLRRALLSAPPPARAVLDRLAAGPPVGTTAAPTQTGEDAGDSPVRWLVARQLLVPVELPSNAVPGAPATAGDNSYDAVELPRELGLLLRRDSGPLGPLRPRPPEVNSPAREPSAVDSAGAGQAMETVRQVEAILDALGAEPPPMLRTGGLGVRELRRIARIAGVDDGVAALLVEIAYAAGLAGETELPAARGTDRPAARGPAAVTQVLLPTLAYDAWQASPVAARWHELARAWLAMARQPGLVGQRDGRDRVVTALSAEVERAAAPTARRAVLTPLADLPPGAAPTADELLRLLAWHRPRRVKSREAVYREALDEAARLGVTGLGALTSYGRLLLAPGADEATDDPLGLRPDADEPPTPSQVTRVLDALLPAPVDHMLVQADLTIVVPGPPEPALAAELDLVAEHESAGGAGVYRVTADSIRRAMDAGYAAED
ncbi:MAG TPA: helicase-associated domain-containing protein, partial [Pilimelia sp.]|nr:helicase-associated domain-containing protein [Pilimelia sp.]